MFFYREGPFDAPGRQPPAPIAPIGWFDDRVLIQQFAPGGFVYPTVNAPAQFWQNRDGDKAIFQDDRLIGARRGRAD